MGTITIIFENILKLSSIARQNVFLFGRMKNFFVEGKIQFFAGKLIRKSLCTFFYFIGNLFENIFEEKNITIKSFVSSCKERFLGGV